MNIVQKLVNYFKAGYPCLAIQTTEEKRAQGDLFKAAHDSGRKIVTWSSTEGIMNAENGKQISSDEMDVSRLEDALRYFFKIKLSDTVIILRDIHSYRFDSNPELSRVLRDVITESPETGTSIVIISPSFKPYESITNLMTMVDYSLPNEDEMREIAKGVQESGERDNKKKIKKADDTVIKALSGLSTTEAENALSLCLVETGGKFSPEIIYREKIAAVKRSGLLEIVNPNPRGLDSLGGLENIKHWILERKEAYSPEAKEYGILSPRGVFLVGFSGCGKSHTAKVIGTALGIPTLKLDIGSMFAKFVGESEQRMRDALKLAEAMSPCVVFVDEADKGLAGAKGGETNEVAQRVFGILLTWMEENTKPCFVVMTANSVSTIPAPLLRPGRFDAIFSVDLPNVVEREQIASVWIAERSRDPKNFDLKRIAELTKDFSGAEIKAAIHNALLIGFNANKRPITTDDIITASNSIVPLAKSMSEDFKSSRILEGMARPASAPIQESASISNRKLKI